MNLFEQLVLSNDSETVENHCTPYELKLGG